MKKTFRKIVQVLDGKPGAMKGQSLVEMAFTFPILIFMILGLAEIGWLANNYLILMDVVRASGRAAVGASPNTSQWPDAWTRNYNHMDCDDSSMTPLNPLTQFHRLGNTTVTSQGELVDDDRNLGSSGDAHTGPSMRGQNLAAALPDLSTAPYNFGIRKYEATQDDVNNPEGILGFFDGVACQVTNSLSPLVFNDLNYPLSKDDIVVSSVSYQLMKYARAGNNPGSPTFNNTTTYFTGPNGAGGPGTHGDDWVTVTGRWPKSNRYCVTDGPTNTGSDYRDPFDYKRKEFSSIYGDGSPAIGPLGAAVAAGETDNLDSMEGYGNPDDTVDNNAQPLGSVNPITTNPTTPIHSILNPSSNEGIRGYVFTGNSYDPASGCYGSKFTVQDIEDRLNLDANYNQYVPNGGLIIIEVFWQHHPLVFGPLFEGFTGNPNNDPVLWVWGMFPLPNVEPTATSCATGSVCS